MKKFILFFIAFVSFYYTSTAQQLIADPGFENWNGSSGNYLGPCFDWYENSFLPWPSSNMGTPDHHHEANPIGSNLTSADPNCTLTGSNFSGCGAVYAGQGCLGIWTETNSTFDGTREVAGTQLTSPMIVGECYKVSFWVQAKTNSANYYRYISGQGVMFSMTQYPSYDPSTVDYTTLSNSYVATDSIIRDTIWHYIEMTFQADQPYTHAFVGILGNWTDINTDLASGWGNAVGPYYWFDEVKVEQLQSCCETNIDLETTTPETCGMMDGTFTVDPAGTGPYTFVLIDNATGLQVTSNNTGVFTGLATGDYFVNIYDAHCSFNSDTLNVGQTGTPVYGLTGSDPTLCGGADGTIEISSLVDGITYDIYYDDPTGVTVGPITFTADATGIYTISGLVQGNYSNVQVDFNGCSALVGDYQLNDPSGVTLNVSLNPILLCGDIPEIVLSGMVPGESYDWSFDTGYSGSGTVADANGEIIVVVTPGTYSNFQATQLSSACTAINSDVIDVVDVTPVNATAVGTSGTDCINGGQISFQSLEPNVTYNIYWPGGDSLLAVSSGSGVINIPFPVGTWGDFVVENATTLCNDTLPQLTIVNPIDPADSINTIYGIDETCFGDNDGEVYVFDFGFLIYDIYIDSALMSPANTTNLAPGTYEVVKHNTITGCFVEYNITVNPGPVCCSLAVTHNVDIDPTCGATDGQVTLTATDPIGPVTYSVDGGPSQSSAVFTGLASGTYQFIATDSAGCADTLNVTLTPAGVVAPNVSNDTTYCDGDVMANLTTTGNMGGTFDWYDDPALTNNIGTGSSFAPLAIIGQTTYYVTESIAGCVSPAASVTVTINAIPNAPTAGTDTTYCSGDPLADITANGSGGTINWYDDVTLTNNIGTGSPFTPLNNAGTTTYYATETVNGCESAGALVTITINDLPVITNEAVTGVTSCSAPDGSITITSNGTDFELFDNTGVSISSNTNGTFTGLGTGSYYVEVLIGNCMVTSSVLIVDDLTSTSIDTLDYTVCEGDSFTFADGTQISNILASTSYTSTLMNTQGCDSVIVENIAVNPIISFVVDTTVCAGVDYVFADGTSHVNILQDQTHISVLGASTGCDSIVTENVTVIPAPTIDLGPDLNVCSGETVTITATSTGGTPLWSTGDTGNSIVYIANSDTSFYAEITTSCGVASDTINITVVQAPIIDAGTDVTIPLGATTDLLATSTNPTVYFEWDPAQYLSCSACPDPTASPYGTTTFIVTGTDENGCVGYDTVTVTIDGEVTVYIPNIFSPNNDGQNDFFVVHGPVWSKYRMQVFNRWGAIVFESEDPNIEWDGKAKNGDECPQAVFVYKFTGTTVFGQLIERAGNVMLTR